MSHDQQSSLSARLRKAKAALLAVALTLAGILLIMANGWLPAIDLGHFGWLHAFPLGELGGTLFGAGLLGTLFEYSFRKDQEEATVEQFRTIIKEQAPAMRDAVIEGFAIHPDDLKRVANPQLLDDIASNVMSLRLGDEQFAREIYRDIRDQAIGSAERWHDVEVRVRLSTAVERSVAGAPLFDVVVEWEYTTVPSGPVRRFACVSDRDEYNDLREDVPATSTWLMMPRPGMDASSRDCYELLEVTVDGEVQAIRRSARKTGQTYSVHLGSEALSGNPVRIRQVFRTVTPTWGHRLFFELPQPGRDVSLTLDYTNTNIAYMRVSDTVGALVPPRISEMPRSVPGRVIAVETPGWLMAKAGFAFTWTLNTELPREEYREAA
ncbi:hypothetical protein O6072_18340 [Mycolicibacterium neoaurum]|uniref:hypothetical protein n=1 Tax=Mycolicibacterium neoaurum TaxID=1795 RepID=UPI00248BC79B|nr:hypothetical protein [Mycolicibacterium neoaurum]WBP93219.1 hypothetical protein O7W24_18905 [Mycolicibacterium neoaurum]WBS06814.1 hypothetical protein O6072_18340 [Mycolicibacterium neoaurum]